jgi:hypothetical protein
VPLLHFKLSIPELQSIQLKTNLTTSSFSRIIILLLCSFSPTNSPPSDSRVFQIPENNNYWLSYKGRLRSSKAHCFSLSPKCCSRRPCSLHRFSVKTDVDSSTARIGVIGLGVNLESFASVKACASHAESLDRLDTAIVKDSLLA